MSDLRTAALRALAALSCLEYDFCGITDGPSEDTTEDAITALKEALAEPGSAYENGFVDGMLEQARRSVDKAVNAMAKPIIKPEIKEDKPFGYFRAEPFGWTDCAPTDEGAIPLYERPQAQQFLYNAWADEQIQKEKK